MRLNEHSLISLIYLIGLFNVSFELSSHFSNCLVAVAHRIALALGHCQNLWERIFIITCHCSHSNTWKEWCSGILPKNVAKRLRGIKNVGWVFVTLRMFNHCSLPSLGSAKSEWSDKFKQKTFSGWQLKLNTLPCWSLYAEEQSDGKPSLHLSRHSISDLVYCDLVISELLADTHEAVLLTLLPHVGNSARNNMNRGRLRGML